MGQRGRYVLQVPMASCPLVEYNTADLKTFLADLRPDISSSTTFTLQTLDGVGYLRRCLLPHAKSDAGLEPANSVRGWRGGGKPQHPRSMD